MKCEPKSLKLVSLTPEDTEAEETLRSYATQLAEILNTDRELPPGFKSPPDVEPHTSDNLLSFVKEWCEKRNALFFFIVMGGDVVVGSISLSHIDLKIHSARTGYFLATHFQGKGIGSKAFSLLLDIARQQGLQSISGSVPKTNIASRKLWEKYGATDGATWNEVTVILDNGGKILTTKEQ